MATKRMLVDATHPEETRIVVMSGNRLEEFDFEAASRRQLRGNIYLAKVTRVEPSLQAAFIEYGGNRHGFLAFSEIHPDYYQIPVADREALLADEARSERAEAENHNHSMAEHAEGGDTVEAEAGGEDESEDGDAATEAVHSDQTVESVGGADAMEEMPERRRPRARQYKIQEVIKRRQVMLVQVVKEERGNKGAALTSYLSLAGRYSVLMPNTARGGGISRKITNSVDRKKLKEIAGELEVPEGMGIILRTAGASRTKAEVKRDFEYLLRLWENVRNLTLKSTAPCLVYEEGSLIKRTIRDLYNKDIDEVLIAGDDAYREAKDFMRMIMPSHAKNVQGYKEDQPIFSKFSVETQLDSMFSSQVTLPSGGYIVLDPTEALVSIDVNSGRATKEHNIEDTALQTNLEAADEVARQLRLRDLAGLIVIDFIDMMEKRSNRLVERRLKEALKYDRARIQVGRISHFGLLEMSRQRIRFGVVESSTHVCPICHGSGHVRSVESVALMVVRAVEDHVMRRPGNSINVRVPVDVALYILNSKRGILGELENRNDLSITISADAKLVGSQFSIDRGEARIRPSTERLGAQVQVDSAEIADIDEDEVIEETEDEGEASSAAEPHGDGDDQPRRRRRRRRGGRDRQSEDHHTHAAETETEPQEATAAAPEGEPPHSAEEGEDADGQRRRRRRGRRGGRRNRRLPGDERPEGEGMAEPAMASEVSSEAVVAELADAPMADLIEEAPMAEPVAEAEAPAEVDAPITAKPRRSRRKKADDVVEAEPVKEVEVDAAPVAEKPAARKRAPAKKAAKAAEVVAEALLAAEPVAGESSAPRRAKKELPPEGVVVTSSTAEADAVEEKPKKGGWWQKGFLG